MPRRIASILPARNSLRRLVRLGLVGLLVSAALLGLAISKQLAIAGRGAINRFLPIVYAGGEINPSPTATIESTVTEEPTAIVTSTSIFTPTVTSTPVETQPVPTSYVLLGWNDLGMHCLNADFSNLAVLPPYNTLWAQVVLRGDPPQVITSGINVSYSFAANTYSAGKTNFWDYDLQLFGVDLPVDVGLAGKGLSGLMDLNGDHFEAIGIPLTEYEDNQLDTRQPFQLADIVVSDAETGQELASNQVVAPVSSEMSCSNCHYDGGVEGIATGNVDTNILTFHDQENLENYPPGHTGPLMGRRPILCAECHSSNALGAPGVPGLPSLSNAMHEQHAEIVPDTLDGCYNCHPGQETRCLRDVMSTQYDKTCIDCHGGMLSVAANPDPWLNEPRCDTCHAAPGYEQDQALYRHSSGHGGLYCESCHDSTHAIALSREPRDAIKFINLQGYAGTLTECTVCHITDPGGNTPHGQ